MAFGTAPAAVLALSVLLGLSSNAARPAFAAMVADVVPPADRVRAFALNYWAINLGFAIAPGASAACSRRPATARSSSATPSPRCSSPS